MAEEAIQFGRYTGWWKSHAEYDRRRGPTIDETGNVAPRFDNNNPSAKFVESECVAVSEIALDADSQGSKHQGQIVWENLRAIFHNFVPQIPLSDFRFTSL